MLQHSSLRLLGLAAALALVAAGAPAFGQDFNVVGQNKTIHESSLTAAVHSADLDLTTKDGRAVLQQRIRSAAHQLCRELGDNTGPVGLAFTCEDDAVEAAAPMQWALIAEARAAASRSPRTATQAANSVGPVASAAPSR